MYHDTNKHTLQEKQKSTLPDVSMDDGTSADFDGFCERDWTLEVFC